VVSDSRLTRLKIGVLCGGDSSEREISLRSGRAVLESLKRSGFSVCQIDPKETKPTEHALSEIDLAFIALHGKGGEDGAIQRRLEKKKIAYVGSDPQGSRQAMDKVCAKKIFERAGILTPPWKRFDRRSWKRLERFSAPFFIKPVADGSSIGVFLVEDFHQSAEEIIRAMELYPKLLAEQKIEGREFTVSILGKRALPVVELRPKGKFYDYHCKYTAGMTEYLVPAPLPEAWRRRFQQVALRAHEALGLRDFSRVDLVADAEGRPFVLEANTIPGFTELSLLPKAAREAGISFDELCKTLIGMAGKRRDRVFRNHGKT
jgi:D-alanine-D-alanine ligase